MVMVQHTAKLASTGFTALSKLCQANLGVLTQKLGLLSSLTNKHGSKKAKELFKTTCPLVQASIGQHFRHSLDHMELAGNIAASPKMGGSGPAQLHYDIRERGCSSEHDMDAAAERIFNIINRLEVVALTSENKKPDDKLVPKQELPVQACFMLSGDSGTECALMSSIGRELGFAAHHAIHHMAMVKLIATQTAGLADSDLPNGFGRAPSTILFDETGGDQQ